MIGRNYNTSSQRDDPLKNTLSLSVFRLFKIFLELPSGTLSRMVVHGSERRQYLKNLCPFETVFVFENIKIRTRQSIANMVDGLIL
jgi:hypothetical protein